MCSLHIFGEESEDVGVDKVSMLEMGKNSENRNESICFVWDFFQIFRLCESGTVMMPKLNYITYKQWQ